MDYLGRVEKQLDLPPSEKAEVMKELRTHYEEFAEELVASGMDREQAEREAARKVGKPEDIATQLRKVHGRVSWKVIGLTATLTVLLTAALDQLWLRAFSHEWPTSLHTWWLILGSLVAALVGMAVGYWAIKVSGRSNVLLFLLAVPAVFASLVFGGLAALFAFGPLWPSEAVYRLDADNLVPYGSVAGAIACAATICCHGFTTHKRRPARLA